MFRYHLSAREARALADASFVRLQGLRDKASELQRVIETSIHPRMRRLREMDTGEGPIDPKLEVEWSKLVALEHSHLQELSAVRERLTAAEIDYDEKLAQANFLQNVRGDPDTTTADSRGRMVGSGGAKRSAKRSAKRRQTPRKRRPRA